MWKWVFAGGLGLIITATIASLGKLETVNPDHQGVVIRNGEIQETRPPGKHFLLPRADSVMQVSTAPVTVTKAGYQTETSLGHLCAFKTNYTYAVVDVTPSARRHLSGSAALDYGSNIRDLVMRTLNSYSNSVTWLEFDEAQTNDVEEHLQKLIGSTFGDGTKLLTIDVRSIGCTDLEEENRKLEQAGADWAAKWRIGDVEPFALKQACGNITADALSTDVRADASSLENRAVSVESINVFHTDRRAAEGFEPNVRMSDAPAANLVMAFTDTAIRNHIRTKTADSISKIDWCTALLENPQLDSDLGRWGLEIVALNLDSAHFSIAQPIE